MKLISTIKKPYTSAVVNFCYAIANMILGFTAYSQWFITVGAYYTVLAVTRFCVLQMGKKPTLENDTGLFIKRTTGILLVMLSFCLIGVNILSIIKDRGTVFHEIIMITIATYTFTKITIAIIQMVKAREATSHTIKVLRNISLSDACVSVYTLQRSMLVSFPGMEPYQIQIFNILTATAVWLVVLFLGINLIRGKHKEPNKIKRSS